ncbi:hypothetical protein D3C72_2346190 [compost metagenome]
MDILVARLRADQEIDRDPDEKHGQQNHQPGRVGEGHGDRSQNRADHCSDQGPLEESEVDPPLAPEGPGRGRRAETALDLVGGDGGHRSDAGGQ